MKVLGSPYFVIIFVTIFIYLLARYWISLKHSALFYKFILITLRSTILMILLLLLLNPWFVYDKSMKESQSIDIIFDLSESMFLHFEENNLSYNQIINNIQEYLGKFEVDVNYYTLSEEISLLEDFLDTLSYSYFSKIPDFISTKNSDQIILITDGKPTSGLELNSINFSKNIPINILGVGSVDLNQDISIESVLIPPKVKEGDLVNLKINFRANIKSDINSMFEIKNKDILIYNKLISFKKGEQLKEIKLSLTAADLSGLNQASLSAIDNEASYENNNNIFLVNVESLSESIILITGSLSSNTSFIKSIINSMSSIDIAHYFRVNNNEWNKEIDLSLHNTHKILILDDFPIYNEDETLFKAIVKDCNIKNIPIVYLGGPNSNLSSAEIISSIFNNFNHSIIRDDILTEISLVSINPFFSDIDFNSFPPQYRTIKWMSNYDNDLEFKDGSLLASGDDQFYIVSLPSIMGTHLKTKNNYTSSVVKLLNKIFINKIYGENGLISIHINKNLFHRGEILTVQLLPVESLGTSDFYLETISSSFDTLLTSCVDNDLNNIYNCKVILNDFGELKISGFGISNDGKKLRSKQKIIYVQDINTEMKDLVQDKIALIQISNMTDGIYMHIDSLDAMLSSIQINPLQLVKKYQLSAIKTQQYWWLLILFLSSEWFIRKKIGLL